MAIMPGNRGVGGLGPGRKIALVVVVVLALIEIFVMYGSHWLRR